MAEFPKRIGMRLSDHLHTKLQEVWEKAPWLNGNVTVTIAFLLELGINAYLNSDLVASQSGVTRDKSAPIAEPTVEAVEPEPDWDYESIEADEP